MAKQKLQDWVEARRRFRLSDAHVQMARELGMNPRELGKVDNHHQERWKAPLPEFIERLYEKRFGRLRPAVVMSVEEGADSAATKKAARKEARLRGDGGGMSGGGRSPCRNSRESGNPER